MKRINEFIVKIVLVFVYVFGIGLSFVIRMFMNKPKMDGSSFWKSVEVSVMDQVSKEGY